MEQSPSWEADGHSAGEEIDFVLWRLGVVVYATSDRWTLS